MLNRSMLNTTSPAALKTAALTDSSSSSAVGDSSLHAILTTLETGFQQDGAAACHMDEAQAAIFEVFRGRFASPVVAKVMTLKVLNLWLAKHHLQARSAHLGSRPIAHYVDPSNSCNLGCPGCVHSTTSKHLFDWKPGMMSQSRLETLFHAYAPFAAHVGFYNYGDPLVNPLTPKFIKLAKTFLIHTAASTNLSFAKFDAGAYVDSGLDFLTLSIDGATQPVYERFRRKGKLDVVLGNVEKLAEARRQRGKGTPILSWNFLAFEHNAHEIGAARQLAKDLDVDQFSVFTPFDVSWDDPTVRIANVAPSVEKLKPNFVEAIHANFNPFPGELAAESIEREFAISWSARLMASSASGGAEAELVPREPGHTCHWLYKAMVMDAGGRVLPCCAAPSPQRDLVFSEQGDQVPGTLDYEAADHYNSAKYNSVRSYFADPESYRRAATAGETQPHCVKCEWNQTETNFGNQHLRNYFTGAELHAFSKKYEGSGSLLRKLAPALASDVFDAASLEMLCNW
jgi:MoaA/NifB/PqqE/SkfB family radical SAM enzyme